ncbi:MAG: sulfatase, partial [Verrucomicrobia bacterium]|nr:sulfatase [Verrucomicrobiota bacterium]
FEIYNVVADPQERTNLANLAAYASLQQCMQARVLQVRRPDPGAPRPYDRELVPAVSIPNLVSGIEWRTCERRLPWVATLEDLAPSAVGTARRIAGGRLPAVHGGGALFSGFIRVPADGDYTFYVSADGGALLRLHEAVVIDADAGYVPRTEAQGAVRLQAGLHPFRLYYRRGDSGAAFLRFQWRAGDGRKRDVPASVLFRPQSGG